jgi:tetratricopeptide (TPR) repeat protein
MTPKKKTTVAMNAAAGTDKAESVLTVRRREKAIAEDAGAAAAPPKDLPQDLPRPTDLQLNTWNDAVQMFSQRRFEEALPLFREASRGPAVHVADKARSYEQICLRHCTWTQVEFRTAEDHFYYGVERLNAGDLPQARNHLSLALKLQPEGDHIYYTLALCCGYDGDGNGACENLKRAIDLEPRNRVMAKQDSEFTGLAQQFPALRMLLTHDVASDS